MAATGPGFQERVKSGGLRSFINHKRAGSDGTRLPAAQSLLPTSFQSVSSFDADPAMGLAELPKAPQPLGELQQNHQGQTQRSPRKLRSEKTLKASEERSRSPEKRGFATISLKSLAAKDPSRSAKPKETDLGSPKKTKSSTNLVGLLSRPKSSKNLAKLATDQDFRPPKDKENRTPPTSVASELEPPPPIYAQFCSPAFGPPQSQPATPQQYVGGNIFDAEMARQRTNDSFTEKPALKQRPRSFQPPFVTKKGSIADMAPATPTSRDGDSKRSKQLTWGKGGKTTRANILSAFPGLGGSTPKSTASQLGEPTIDPKDIDRHLEAMLDRRNIPENQRYKMRNLNDTIKMEFIRQDWAEATAKGSSASPTETPSETNLSASDKSVVKEVDSHKKHSRGRSFTLSKGAGKSPGTQPKKAKGESTIGRHFRSRSTDSIVSDRPSSSSSSTGTSILSKVKGQLVPTDFVQYLRKVQKPELVEVGKLHKLRLLLRNETVAWAEEFIRQGGMKEVVGLLHRIMEVEWREEHEDALLHENLLCLKALCTTALAVQYLQSIHATLFPALLHMLFDPEKKGPSEFTTRNIITSVLLTYIESATPRDRVDRAQVVLGYLRDPEGKEDERPVSFVLEMRRERPYKVWCKEAVNVTKEVFWIFLHHLNVVSLPAPDKSSSKQQEAGAASSEVALQPGPAPSTAADLRPDSAGSASEQASGPYAYMSRHFPQERPPVPAAPYVGGVEWDATNYLASHLDLMNAIIACVPGVEARNELREALRMSGWERCLGGSLRLCKEKFYGAVHDGLRRWVAAAAEDGWDVREVRFGPPPGEARSSPKKKRGGGGENGGAGGGDAAGGKRKEAPPRIEMPKLDFALGGGGGGVAGNGAEAANGNGLWLS